jgi:hypothetical protein
VADPDPVAPDVFQASGATSVDTLEAAMSKPTCPHCHEPLAPFRLPDESGWQTDFHVACFNDECPYYRSGWGWMEDHYGVKTSYRFRIDPATGKSSPLAVWSSSALRDRILDAEITVSEVTA